MTTNGYLLRVVTNCIHLHAVVESVVAHSHPHAGGDKWSGTSQKSAILFKSQTTDRLVLLLG